MTTSNDDQTTQLPEFDVTTPLPTTPAPSVGQDATVEMPTSSPDLSSDPLAIFREAPTTQMPIPFGQMLALRARRTHRALRAHRRRLALPLAL